VVLHSINLALCIQLRNTTKPGEVAEIELLPRSLNREDDFCLKKSWKPLYFLKEVGCLLHRIIKKGFFIGLGCLDTLLSSGNPSILSFLCFSSTATSSFFLPSQLAFHVLLYLSESLSNLQPTYVTSLMPSVFFSATHLCVPHVPTSLTSDKSASIQGLWATS
jgi:hypothetical protein